MSETRTVHDPFFGKDVQVSDALVDRLRGKYAQGPTMPNGEPEFGWRQYSAPAIQVTAADEIERLRKALTQIAQISDNCVSAEICTAAEALNHLQGIRNIIKSFAASAEQARERDS